MKCQVLLTYLIVELVKAPSLHVWWTWTFSFACTWEWVCTYHASAWKLGL